MFEHEFTNFTTNYHLCCNFANGRAPMTIQAYHLILIRLDAQFHLIVIQQAKERLILQSLQFILLLCFPKFQEVLPQPWQRQILLCETSLLAFRPN